MKLLDEIVDLLSDKDGSLTGALLKMKVVLHKIGHKELHDGVWKAGIAAGGKLLADGLGSYYGIGS